MAMSQDDDTESIFDNVASKKSTNVLGAVMSGIEKDITPQEVWNKRRIGIHPSQDQGSNASFTILSCRR